MVQKKVGVIVVGNHVQSLGIIRSLGRHKIPVYLLNDKNLCIGRFSRYLTKFVKCPDIKNSPMLLNFLVEFAKKEKVKDWILMPTNDAAVYTLSKNKKILEEYYKVPTPNWDITKFIYNKKLTYQIAEKNNIPIAKTIYPESLDAIKGISSSEVSFPVIVKGIKGYEFYKKTGFKALKINSEKELVQKYIELSAILDPSETMIQEIISNPSCDYVYSFCSLFKNKKPTAVWIGRKIREHPKSFGTGTFAESKYVPELESLGTCLLRAIDYYGISEAEFKKDKDGVFKLIEINARTWLWHSLAIRCGVDFPYLLYKDMVGEEVETIKSFQENVKWIHMSTDLWMGINEILKGRMKLTEYISSIKGEKEFAVFSIDDPLPFIAETIMLPYLLVTR